jgi:hypothetical protein
VSERSTDVRTVRFDVAAMRLPPNDILYIKTVVHFGVFRTTENKAYQTMD